MSSRKIELGESGMHDVWHVTAKQARKYETIGKRRADSRTVEAFSKSSRGRPSFGSRAEPAREKRTPNFLGTCHVSSGIMTPVRVPNKLEAPKTGFFVF